MFSSKIDYFYFSSSTFLFQNVFYKAVIRHQEHIYYIFLYDVSCMIVWCITTNYGKFLKRWEYQTTWPASWEIGMQVKWQQLELNMEQQTVSKSGKEYLKAVYCHPGCLTYMQSTSCEMLGWMKHKLESRLLEQISVTSDIQMTTPLWEKVKMN